MSSAVLCIDSICFGNIKFRVSRWAAVLKQSQFPVRPKYIEYIVQSLLEYIYAKYPNKQNAARSDGKRNRTTTTTENEKPLGRFAFHIVVPFHPRPRTVVLLFVSYIANGLTVTSRYQVFFYENNIWWILRLSVIIILVDYYSPSYVGTNPLPFCSVFCILLLLWQELSARIAIWDKHRGQETHIAHMILYCVFAFGFVAQIVYNINIYLCLMIVAWWSEWWI